MAESGAGRTADAHVTPGEVVPFFGTVDIWHELAHACAIAESPKSAQ